MSVSGIGPGLALLALIGLALWLLILTWLAERVLGFLQHRTGWSALDPRNLLAAFVLLAGAIHLGNFALDRLDGAIARSGELAGEAISLGFPGAFLIGSVAIGVGIAAVRLRGPRR